MRRRNIAALMLGIVATTFLVYAANGADGWTVGKDKPTAIGPLVASGHAGQGSPDVSWQAPASGLLQFISHDSDAKCGKLGHIVEILPVTGTLQSYPVPTPPGPCSDPQDGLYASREFSLTVGDIAEADTREDSGQLEFFYVTYTPTPAPTATSTSTPTPTPTPTSTATATPEPTATMTTLTATPTATPTATDTPAPPDTPEPAPTDEITALDPGIQPGQPTIRIRYYLPLSGK